MIKPLTPEQVRQRITCIARELNALLALMGAEPSLSPNFEAPLQERRNT